MLGDLGLQSTYTLNLPCQLFQFLLSIVFFFFSSSFSWASNRGHIVSSFDFEIVESPFLIFYTC